jgi:hypothetical protein
MKSRLAVAMLLVVGEQQRLIEKNLLYLGLGYAVLLILAGVASIPVETDVGADVRHGRPLYMSAIYHLVG